MKKKFREKFSKTRFIIESQENIIEVLAIDFTQNNFLEIEYSTGALIHG